MGVDISAIYGKNEKRLKMKPIIAFSSVIFIFSIIQFPSTDAKPKSKKSGDGKVVKEAANSTDNGPSTATGRQMPSEDNYPCSAPNGGVMMSFPEKCMQLTCNDGFLTPTYYYGKNSCQCCEFDGKIYKNGETLPGVCARVICMNGKWNATGHIHECCKQCRVYDDPHIKTFDSPDTGYNWYDWHTPCNYSLAQEFHENMDSYYPSYGVFGNFKYCWGVACVDEFTYKDSESTYIKIGVPHGNHIEINGNPYDITEHPAFVTDQYGNEHPVLAWRYNANCIRIMGTRKILLQVCNRDIRIFAHEALSGQLGGLCGYFNHYDQDDHMDRNMNQYSVEYYPQNPSFWFPSSWTTDYNMQCIKTTYDPNIVSDNFKDSISWEHDHPVCQKREMEMYKEHCYSYLMQAQYNFMPPTEEQLKSAAGSCAYDLCAIYTNGVEVDIELWLKRAVQMLNDTIDIDSNTIGEEEMLPENLVTDPPCNIH